MIDMIKLDIYLNLFKIEKNKGEKHVNGLLKNDILLKENHKLI